MTDTIDEPNGAQNELADLSQLSNHSFLTSLDDDELIDFINKLSQQKSQFTREAAPIEVDPQSSTAGLTVSNEGTIGDVLQSTEDTNTDDVLDIPLAQPKPDITLTQDEDLYTGSQEDGKNLIFGDYKSYFEAKSKNQQKEDEEFINWEKERLETLGQTTVNTTDIFKGCIIHVNGHTRPGIATLHKLIILNGGKFIHHLSSKGSCTHVIASRLTPRKQLEFKNYKVVKPEWLLDSIKKGKILHWAEYSVISVDYGQNILPFGAGNHDVNDKDEAEEPEPEDNGLSLTPLTQEKKESSQTEEALDIAIDAKHPDFLKVFFKKSRLHHLSTWKSDLRAEFLKLALDKARLSQPKKIKTGFKVIIHVDFDCFFATASSLKYPDIDFKNRPVCVSHGGSKANSTADIASCNYVCRKFGVKNGMWVRSAMKLCPDLICLDYDFEAYERISKKFYEILTGMDADCVFPVSIDEALLDITSLVDQAKHVDSVQRLLQELRDRIFQETKCPVSVGASKNVLLAKLSLRHAKPEGQYYLHDDYQGFLDSVNVRDLPGTGRSLETKINQLTRKESSLIRDLRLLEKSKLIGTFGNVTGKKLYSYARGIDDTSINIQENPQEFMRKSVSIDINWGIRFDKIEQVDEFMSRLSKEIVLKLNKAELYTSQIVLKILKRSPHAPVDPPKYLGCGECDAFSKSSRLGIPTNSSRVLSTEMRSMFRYLGCEPKELRGISIHAQKLVSKENVGNQKRLNFAKSDIDIFKKKQALDTTPANPPQEPTIPTTQFNIPSDIDSSVIEELPSSIKKQIEIQREKNVAPVVEIPKQVDLSVFNELPIEIQEELKHELHRRNIKLQPSTPTKPKTYLQQIFTTSVKTSQPTFVRVRSPRKSPKKSPQKKRMSPSPVKLSPSKSLAKTPFVLDKYDEEVMNELPPSLRAAVLKEYKTYEIAHHSEFSKIRTALEHEAESPSTTSDFGMTQLLKPLSFQKKTRPHEILHLIDRWILHTKFKGPHGKDLAIFEEYLELLRGSNPIFYATIVESLNTLTAIEEGICESWITILSKYIKETT